MSDTDRSTDDRRRARRRNRRRPTETAIRDPSELTPKPVLGDVPTTTTEYPGRGLAGTAVRPIEPKHPTEDVEPPYVPSAKAVLDESNKVVADAAGLGGLGTAPQRTATTTLGERLAGGAVRAPEVKPPTDDVDGPRTAKAVIDESNKIIADTVGFGGGGYTPRSMAAPVAAFEGAGYGPQTTTHPGAVARRPFVLGTPHHAAGAAAMAGADPSVLAATTAQATGTDGVDETAINAAILDASLAQVETAIRVMKRDLESLEEYYRELATRRDELDHERDVDDGTADGSDIEAETEAEQE